MPRKKKAKKTLAQQRYDKMVSGFDHDHHYSLEIDWESSRNCANAGCDGICRCATIDYAEIEADSIDLEDISSYLVIKQDEGSILHYCVERLLTTYIKAYDPDVWTIGISRGYYGEEIDEVKLEILGKERVEFLALLNLANVDRIKYILTQEYGYLLPEIEEKTKASIKKVSIKDVVPAQNAYPKQVSSDVYDERELPVAVCIKNRADKYRIIDGHHRYASAMARDLTKIPIVLLY